MKINDIITSAHDRAKSAGFWDGRQDIHNKLSLINNEVSEAIEEYRDGHKPNETYYSGKRKFMNQSPYGLTQFAIAPTQGHIVGGISCMKPEGIPSELADIVIRVCDICGFYEIDLEAIIKEKMEYNETRPSMHGGKII